MKSTSEPACRGRANTLRQLLLAGALFCSGLAVAQEPEYKHWLLGQRLPEWALSEFSRLRLDSLYDWSDHINPFYLEADFNGDSVLDVAIAIVQRSSGKKGILMLHGAHAGHAVLGAGTSFSNGGDDFEWADVWRVHRDTRASEMVYSDAGGTTGTREFQLKGAALVVEKAESAGALIYWDGRKYRWGQTGD